MKTWGITFVGDFYNLFTIIDADDEEQAERFAIQNIDREYGWNLADTYFETKIEQESHY
jgi:hypothetical protein